MLSPVTTHARSGDLTDGAVKIENIPEPQRCRIYRLTDEGKELVAEYKDGVEVEPSTMTGRKITIQDFSNRESYPVEKATIVVVKDGK